MVCIKVQRERKPVLFLYTYMYVYTCTYIYIYINIYVCINICVCVSAEEFRGSLQSWIPAMDEGEVDTNRTKKKKKGKQRDQYDDESFNGMLVQKRTRIRFKIFKSCSLPLSTLYIMYTRGQAKIFNHIGYSKRSYLITSNDE